MGTGRLHHARALRGGRGHDLDRDVVVARLHDAVGAVPRTPLPARRCWSADSASRCASPGCPRWSILVLQALAGFLAAQALITGYGLPTPTALADLGARWTGALESSRFYAAPVPSSAAGVEPLLILGGLACLVLVDLLACSLRRVPLAGLPLLVIYTIPVSMTGVGVSWWVFAVVSRRLRADALPPGERAPLALGTHPGTGLRGRATPAASASAPATSAAPPSASPRSRPPPPCCCPMLIPTLS